MHRDDSSSRRGSLVGIVLTIALVAGACTSETSSHSGTGGEATERIPQPVVPADLPVAPDADRVDLTVPTFSDPTNVTNPWFPVSRQDSVLMLGHVDGRPFRTEVTLLPETRIIDWESHRIETLVSQYVAYLDGRLQEVAYDLYAQADDGSVWYFGEDVADFERGVIVTKEGTWITGKDGPAAMIMPADPKVGQAYRTENIPGIAFEEVTIDAVDQTLDGPLGPIHAGVTAVELHYTGRDTEDKTFAPGYGEFRTAGAGDVEALALAVPTDAAPGPVPGELETLSNGGLEIFQAAGSNDWRAATTTVRVMTAAWARFPPGEVPRLIEPRMIEALDALAVAVARRDTAAARQAAIDTARSSFDLQLRYRPQTEIDLARFDLWAAQLQVDVAAGDAGAMNGDAFTLDYIRDRILDSLDGAQVERLNILLERLQIQVLDRNLAAASNTAGRLREEVAGIQSSTST